MTTPVSDKIFLGAGGVLFAAACAWAFMQQGRLAELDGKVTVPSSGAAYSPEPLPPATISEAQLWPEAKALPRGDNWVYDVFTPPVIYYDTETRQFTVTPPTVTPPEVETPVVVPFGVNLVKIVQYPFPMQLVGYVGEGADARGTFQNMLTDETFFGTTGKKIPELKLEIVAFEAKMVRTTIDGQPVVYPVASARVRNTETGKETLLSNTERLIEAEPAAVVRVDGEETTRELRAGATFTVGDTTYVLDSIQPEPPTVVMTKSGGELEEPKTETLTVQTTPAPSPVQPINPVPEGEPALPEGIFPGF